jgi:hypothetical protein
MYNCTDKRKVADWVKTKNKAKSRSPIQCKHCGITWTPIYLSYNEPGQYKSTCSLACTKELQKSTGRKAISLLWNDREKMIESSSKGGRKSAATVIKRSKDEIALYELCSTYWPNVTHNRIIIDGWDADIILEDYKVAVLWNGPWHYKQMPHKNHSLAQVQKRDEIKLNKFIALGFMVLTFEDRNYTPNSAFEEIKQRVSVMVARKSHKLQDRFDSETTHPE